MGEGDVGAQQVKQRSLLLAETVLAAVERDADHTPPVRRRHRRRKLGLDPDPSEHLRVEPEAVELTRADEVGDQA